MHRVRGLRPCTGLGLGYDKLGLRPRTGLGLGRAAHRLGLGSERTAPAKLRPTTAHPSLLPPISTCPAHVIPIPHAQSRPNPCRVSKPLCKPVSCVQTPVQTPVPGAHTSWTKTHMQVLPGKLRVRLHPDRPVLFAHLRRDHALCDRPRVWYADGLPPSVAPRFAGALTQSAPNGSRPRRPAYSQAPPSMKSVCQAAWLLTVAVGNLVVRWPR